MNMKFFKLFILTTVFVSVLTFSAAALKGSPGTGEEVLTSSTAAAEEVTQNTTTDPNEEFAEDTDIDSVEDFIPPTLPYVNVAETETTTDTYSRRTYNASFRAYVDDNVKNYIDITVKNLNTGESFDFRLFETNKYFKVVELPIGEYCLVSGTAAGDTSNQYPVEEIYFIVGKTLNVFVPFNVGSPAEPYSHPAEDFSQTGYTIPDYGTVPESDNEDIDTAPSEVILTATPQNKSNIFVKLLPILGLTIIFVVYFFKKRQNRNAASNSEENDYIL